MFIKNTYVTYDSLTTVSENRCRETFFHL